MNNFFGESIHKSVFVGCSYNEDGGRRCSLTCSALRWLCNVRGYRVNLDSSRAASEPLTPSYFTSALMCVWCVRVIPSFYPLDVPCSQQGDRTLCGQQLTQIPTNTLHPHLRALWIALSSFISWKRWEERLYLHILLHFSGYYLDLKPKHIQWIWVLAHTTLNTSV